MTTWAGFTDRELTHLKSSEPPKKEASLATGGKQRKYSYKSVTKAKNAEQKAAEHDDQVKPVARDIGYVDTGPCDSSETSLKRDSKGLESRTSALTSETSSSNQDKELLSSPRATIPHVALHPPDTAEHEDVNSVQLEEQPKINLDALHKKQKEIEEENLKKKTLLHQAIAERYQKSAAEASILNSVQAELNKLDLMLSNDVFILRDRIEHANRGFEAARKRFESAEQEYVSAKISLHKTSEEKELLAEHLYTIIQQNELRKASRLNDLMGKLHLGGEQAGSELEPSSPVSESHQPQLLSVVQRTPTPAITMSQVSKGLGMPDQSKIPHPPHSDPSKSDPSNKDPSKSDPSNKDPSNKDPSNKDPSNKDPSNKDPSKSDPSNSVPSNKDPSNKDSSSNITPNSNETPPETTPCVPDDTACTDTEAGDGKSSSKAALSMPEDSPS